MCIVCVFLWLYMLQDLKADPKDEFLTILRATVKCLIFPEKYFSKVLRLGINKLGTDEGAVTRVVATRAEVDMKSIKELFEKRNSVPLDKAIAKDTHGDYEKMLLTLIGHVEEWDWQMSIWDWSPMVIRVLFNVMKNHVLVFHVFVVWCFGIELNKLPRRQECYIYI